MSERDTKVMFSVVIPLYNRADMFRETMLSIHRQTYRDFEVVIIDDGSTDNSAEVANACIDEFGMIGKVLTIENSGHGAARDHGILNSNGRFIVPIDSDDLWLPGYLNQVQKAITKCEHPERSLIFSDFIQFFESGAPDSLKSDTLVHAVNLNWQELDKEIFELQSDLFRYLVYEQPIFWGAVAFSKALFEQVGPISHHLPGKTGSPVEWEFFLRASLLDIKAVYIKQANTKIRRHPGNMSAELITQYEGELEILRFVYNNYDISNERKKIVLEEYRKRAFGCAYQYFTKYQFQKSRSLFWRLGIKYNLTRSALYIFLTLMPKRLIKFLRKFNN